MGVVNCLMFVMDMSVLEEVIKRAREARKRMFGGLGLL